MSRKRKRYPFKGIMAVVLMGVMLGICLLGVHLYEKKIEVPIEHAGMQMTEHTTAAKTAQVFMNDRWYAQRNMDTLLVMGIDQFGGLSNTDSYNNDSQTDFLASLDRHHIYILLHLLPSESTICDLLSVRTYAMEVTRSDGCDLLGVSTFERNDIYI